MIYCIQELEEKKPENYVASLFRVQDDMDPIEWKQKAIERKQVDMKKELGETRTDCNKIKIVRAFQKKKNEFEQTIHGPKIIKIIRG